MKIKCFTVSILCFFGFLSVSQGSVLTVEDVSVIGAAADDYYTGNRPKLKVINGGSLGKTLVAQAELSSTAALSGLTMGAAGIAGIAYYERTGKDPVYAAASSIASGADALFSPAYQAFKANFVSPESYPASAAQYVGKEGSVGGTISDILNLVNNSASSAYSSLKELIANHSSADPQIIGGSTVGLSSIIDVNGTNYALILNWASLGTAWQDSYNIAKRDYTLVGVSGNYTFFFQPFSPNPILYRYNKVGEGSYYLDYTKLAPVNDPATVPISPGGVDYTGLKDAFNQANMDAALADDIRTALQNLPADQKITSANASPTTSPASPPSPITNNDISNFFTTNTTNVYNQYLNTVNSGGNVDIAQAAAETAKAQEEEAQKDVEEKLNPIDASPFGTVYNPGAFDIPTRFTTFLQNVKTSGLFSFSSAFFDSLPGGGSPLLTIDGGQTFGTHTFDFSQSLGSGLTVLKSVLLALFGFLSVRAVIMKR